MNVPCTQSVSVLGHKAIQPTHTHSHKNTFKQFSSQAPIQDIVMHYAAFPDSDCLVRITIQSLVQSH